MDVRIALDIVRFALETRYEVALIFSHDQDLSEAVQDVKKISMLKNRWIKSACASPSAPRYGPQNPGHQRHGLDPYRSAHLRRLHRPQRLPAE